MIMIGNYRARAWQLTSHSSFFLVLVWGLSHFFSSSFWAPQFFLLFSTFKQVNKVNWNFLTFQKYQKQKFWTTFVFKFFNPTPSWRMGIKIEVIKKLVRDPMLLNMIFKANKNKNKSRRWVVYLKNCVSYRTFYGFVLNQTLDLRLKPGTSWIKETENNKMHRQQQICG